MYFYKAYGLQIESDIEFFQLASCDRFENIDVTIRIGSVPNNLNGINVIQKVDSQSSPQGGFLMNLKTSARFYINNGDAITIDPHAQTDSSESNNYLLKDAFGHIAHQKKWTPLVSSAIQAKNKAILFVGPSGSGKSTTAAALVERGYELITDGLAIVRKKRGIDPQVYSSFPELTLWEDTFDKIDSLFLAKGPAIRKKIEKYKVFTSKFSSFESLPISHIYFLYPDNLKDLNLEPLENFTSLNILSQCMFARDQMVNMNSHQEQFSILNHLINTCKIKILKYQKNQTNLNNRINLIEEDFLNN